MHKWKKCNRYGFNQRQPTQAFCDLAINYYSEMYTDAPNRGQYPVVATFVIAGNSRSTQQLKDLKETD